MEAEEWTLAGEMAARGWTIVKLCKVCDMGRPTMEILLEGGVTLPQFALRIGKRLGLTKEQVKKLGKPLNPKTWLRKDSGMGRPKRINCAKNWYDAMDHKKAVTVDKCVWLDAAAIAKYMWDNDMDMGQWWNNIGFRYGKLNTTENAAIRYARIQEAEEAMGIPAEICETYADMSNTVVQVSYRIDQEKLEKRTQNRKYNYATLRERYIAMHPECKTDAGASKGIARIKEMMHGPMTYQMLQNVLQMWDLDKHDAASMEIVRRKSLMVGGGDADD